MGEQKGGSVVTENPKGGIAESFGRIQRGTIQICLENERMGRGDRESLTLTLTSSPPPDTYWLLMEEAVRP